MSEINEIRHVCCSTDDNYVQHCAVMLCSLFENNKEVQFNVHLLVVDLKDDNVDKLRVLINRYNSILTVYNIDMELLKECVLPINSRITITTYARLFIANLLKSDIEKVLYLDVDIVVIDNILSLFDIDLTGYALAAVKDIMTPSESLRSRLSLPYNYDYFNAGVLLINLTYWRENHSESLFISFINRRIQLDYPDQDVLNAIFKNCWFRLSSVWNRVSTVAYDNSLFLNYNDREYCEKNPKIIHFAGGYGLKPWNNFFFIEFGRFYNYYLRLALWTGTKPYLRKENKLKVYAKIASVYIHKFLYKYELYTLFRFFTFPIRLVGNLVNK